MAAITVDGTVVEEEKVDLEIPQEKVDVKKADEAEPESAGGCDVCLPPEDALRHRHDRRALPAPVAARRPRPRRGEGALPARLLGRRNRLRVLSRSTVMLHTRPTSPDAAHIPSVPTKHPSHRNNMYSRSRSPSSHP